MKQNIIIFGSSSEIGIFKNFINGKDLQPIQYQSDSTELNHLKVTNYIKDIELIKSFIKNIETSGYIFNGYLAENRNDYEPTFNEISQTDYVNFQIPYFLTNEINKSLHVTKFIYISTIASFD